MNCHICGIEGRPDNIRRHITSVHDKIKETCAMCGVQVSTPSALKRHQKFACQKKPENEENKTAVGENKTTVDGKLFAVQILIK